MGFHARLPKDSYCGTGALRRSSLAASSSWPRTLTTAISSAGVLTTLSPVGSRLNKSSSGAVTPFGSRSGSHSLVAVGLYLDWATRTITNKAERVCKLHYGLRQLIAQGRCTGSVMEVIVGHLCFAFGVERCCLAVLSHCYQFIRKYG